MKKDSYKDFENQGWDAMFQTLDREMPVKKKRRGLLWLWWGIGLLSVGSLFLYYKTAKKTPSVQNTVSKPIVYQNAIDTKTDTLVQKMATIQQPRAFAQIGNNRTVRESSKQLNQEPSKMTTRKNNLKKADDAVFDKQDVREEKVVATNLKTIDAIDAIKIGPLSITQDSNSKLDVKPILETIICPQKTKSKLYLGITAGVHTQQVPSTGFQTGLTLTKSLSPKWSFASGLSFRQIKMPSQNQNTAYLALFDVTKSSTSVSASTLLKATSISINKLYYIEMPLTLERMMGKKFAFTTGFKPSFLLTQSIQKSDLAVYWVNNSSFSTSQDLLNDVNAATLGLKRWDIAYVGGISFLPSRHIQLGLRYDFGLLNIFSRANTTVYNRYIGLNLGYSF